MASDVQQCLDLLKGPSDEKRFVGLLLVVKLLPPENASLAKEVWEAVGSRFITRLLFPLTRGDGPGLTPEVLEVKLMGGSVATAVLSALCQFEELAASKDMQDFLPTLIQVWRNQQQIESLGGSLGKSVVINLKKDILRILESLAGVSEVGCDLVLRFGGLQIALVTLKELKGFKCILSMQAMHSMAYLLKNGRTCLNSESPDSACLAVEHMAELLNICPNLIDCDDCEGQSPDPAALQLEALHALLVILEDPFDHIPGLHAQLLHSNTSWDANIRNGLCLILQSKSTSVQRHSALLLAARMIELKGSLWLVDCNAPDPVPQQDTRLLRVVAEIVKVEISILLHDALWCSPQEEVAVGSEVPQEVSTAMEIVPACFQIVESLLDVLVENEVALEEPAGAAGIFKPLDESTALRVMESASDSVEYILEAVDGAMDDSINFFNDTLLLACSRCVGRFLAEVPGGHSESILKCLRPLCSSGRASEGAGFLAPGLTQLANGDDSRKWIDVCLDGPVLQSLLARADLISTNTSMDHGWMRESSDKPSCSPIGCFTGELGAVCQLLFILLSHTSSSKVNEIDPCIVEHLSAWVCELPERPDVLTPALEPLLDVGLLICFLIQSHSAFHRKCPIIQEGCCACLKVVAMGHRGLQVNSSAHNGCTKKWEDLLDYLTAIIARDTHISSALMSSQSHTLLATLRSEGTFPNEKFEILVGALNPRSQTQSIADLTG